MTKKPRKSCQGPLNGNDGDEDDDNDSSESIRVDARAGVASTSSLAGPAYSNIILDGHRLARNQRRSLLLRTDCSGHQAVSFPSGSGEDGRV